MQFGYRDIDYYFEFCLFFFISVCIVSNLLVDCFMICSCCILFQVEFVLCLKYVLLLGEELGSIFEEMEYSVVDSVLFDIVFDVVEDDLLVEVLSGDNFRKFIGKYMQVFMICLFGDVMSFFS